MTNTRTILGAALAGIAALAAFRALAPVERRAPNPARPAPPGCVRDGKAAGSGRCDRCGRPLRGKAERLACDGNITVYCGPTCAGLWLDRAKQNLPVEPPFWSAAQPKCCTVPVQDWDQSEWIGKRTRRQVQDAFASAANVLNWDPNAKGRASTERVLKELGKQKRQAYEACRSQACGVVMVEPPASSPIWAPALVISDSTNPNVWILRDKHAEIPDNLYSIRYNPRDRLWKIQRRNRTVATAKNSRDAIAKAHEIIGLASGVVIDTRDADAYIDDFFESTTLDYLEPPAYDPDIPF